MDMREQNKQFKTNNYGFTNFHGISVRYTW